MKYRFYIVYGYSLATDGLEYATCRRHCGKEILFDLISFNNPSRAIRRNNTRITTGINTECRNSKRGVGVSVGSFCCGNLITARGRLAAFGL